MKLLPIDTLMPRLYAGRSQQATCGYVELNSLLLDERVARLVDLLKSGDKTKAGALAESMADEWRENGGLRLAWVLVVEMWMHADAGDANAVVDTGIEVLRTLVATDDHSCVEYTSIAAAAVYMLALAHNIMCESRKAEKELEKSQRLYGRLAKKDDARFTQALMITVEASTEVYKSKLKKMNVLAHYQVATELYQGKVSAGVSEAVSSLVDSIVAEGDIHLNMGNYRDAVKFYTKALRYQKRISASMGMKELRISVNLGKALLHLVNRRQSGEQLLRSILPLAERMDATAEVEAINALLNDMGKNTFDIAALWKELF